MSPVDPRTLKPGQRVRWTRTVEGVVTGGLVSEDGEGYTAIVDVDDEYGDRHSVMVFSGRHGMDTFEVLAPPLPTEPGSTIVARLVGWTFPRVLARGLKNGQPAWFIAGASECTDTVDPEDITEWALLDGVHTVRDQEPEPQPAREERPCEGCDNAISGCLTPCLQLPTGLGAVVRAKVAGESHPIVLVQTGAADYPWFTEASSGATWRYCGKDLTDVDVLSPGIEIPS